MFDRYQRVIEANKTTTCPTASHKGNIEGGLTTIEEKALGNIQKIGRNCTVDGVLDKAEAPTIPACGSWTAPRRGRRWSRSARPRLRGALLPDRPGQRHRQPDPAGHQDHREPAHPAAR
jgi:hypothetical protein